MADSLPDWLPDWKNENEYPDPTRTSTQEWAWEFLRRNVQYQQAYQKYSDISLELAQQDDDIEVIINGARAKSFESVRQFLAEDRVVQTLMEINSEIINAVTPARQEFMVSAFGGLPNPAKPYCIANPLFTVENKVSVYKPSGRMMLPIEGFLPPNNRHQIITDTTREKLQDNKEERVSTIFKKPTELLIKIDIEWNQKSQLDAIRVLIGNEKRNLNKLGFGKLIRNRSKSHNNEYLRIYDARISGVKRSVLAKEFFPATPNYYPDKEGNHRVDEHFNRAKSIIDIDYLKIASL